MADATLPETAATAGTTRDESGLSVALRRELRDLAVLLALPAMWVDQEPAEIAAGLLDVLFALFHLESGYVRFDDLTGGHALECWRPAGPQLPLGLEQALASIPGRKDGFGTLTVTTSSDDDDMRVTSICPTLPSEEGLILVGARRTDFPTEFELHQLRLAVSQATIAIHTARRFISERTARIAAEAALRQRNAFLESLVHDLAAPLALISTRAEQAHALVSAPDRSQQIAGTTRYAAVIDSEVQAQDDASSLDPAVRLTRRESEVLGLLAQGLSNKEIAGVLWLSDRTVERHITSLYRKIDVQRRSEATAYALRHGLLPNDAHKE